MKNKGMSFVFVPLVMSIIAIIMLYIVQFGAKDLEFSKKANDKSKSYYISEAGIYYGGSVILNAAQAMTEPLETYQINNPFTEYKKENKFTLNITKDGTSYKVISQGIYNGEQSTIEATINISGNNINYSQMKKRN